MVSVDALCRLLRVSATLADPQDREKIFRVLRPYEYTRVDSIIDLVFAATESMDSALPELQIDDAEEDSTSEAPASFHQQCLASIEKRLAKPFVELSTSQYASSDGSTNLVISVSKTYHKHVTSYWYAFYPYNTEFIQQRAQGFVAFGCGSPQTIVLVPANVFLDIIPNLNITKRGERFYYHVQIIERRGRLLITARGGMPPVDVTEFRI